MGVSCTVSDCNLRSSSSNPEIRKFQAFIDSAYVLILLIVLIVRRLKGKQIFATVFFLVAGKSQNLRNCDISNFVMV